MSRSPRRSTFSRSAVLQTAIFTATLGTALLGQPAYLVSDLAVQVPPFPEEYLLSSRDFVSANGLVFFFQDDGIHGRELWRSDGTSLGTFLVRDICPGSCGSRTSYPQTLRAVGDWVFFTANDAVHGLELWITNGSALETRLVQDLVPGWRSSIPYLFTEAGGQLFFVAQTDGNGWELWRSDGTATGTYRLPQPPGVETLAPSSMHAGPGFLYLCNARSGEQAGLWRTDGSAAGMLFLAPVECWPSGYWKGAPMAVLPNGVLVFEGAEDGQDWELWRSDGTLAGTYRVADFVPGSEPSYPGYFTVMGEEILFGADDIDLGRQLWRSDGTLGGTTLVPLPAGVEPLIGMGSATSSGGRYFFSASSLDEGWEPWVLDESGAHLLLDVAPGTASSLVWDWDTWNFSMFAAVGDDLVFFADDGSFGRELWRSNGTSAGTYRITDIAPGSASLLSTGLWDLTPEPVFGGRLYFLERSPEAGLRLWRTNVSATGAELLDVIDGQTSIFKPLGRDRAFIAEFGFGSVCFAAVGSRIFFEPYVPRPEENEIWMSDGSTAGTESRWSAPALDLLRECGAIADKLVFVGGSDGTRGLLSIGAPPLSEELLIPLPGDVAGSVTTPPYLAHEGQLLLGIEPDLWSTEGTATTTSPIVTGWVGPGTRIDPWNGRILGSGSALWLTDPEAPSGAIALTEHDSTAVAALLDLAVFIGADETHGSELWATDGTPEGTSLLADIVPGPESSFDRYSTFDAQAEARESRILSLGILAVFATNDRTHGDELWVTDGTPLGTGLVKDIYVGDYPSTPRHFTRLADHVLFTAEDEEHGLELWTTDGSYEGTALVKDVAPGAASSNPDDLVVRDGTLYFSAWSPTHGREAWRSDGTLSGTVRITDIAPGSLSASPQRFIYTDSRLFFTATDQIHGFELWAVPDDGFVPLFLDGFETESTSRWSLTEP